MTFIEMYDLFNSIIDKAGSPYLSEEEFDKLCNVSYGDWVMYWYERFESNQESVSRLNSLQRIHTVFNTAVALSNAINPKCLFVLKVSSKHRRECNGKIDYIERSCKPTSIDDIDIVQQDPFNKGSDLEPNYINDTAGSIPAFRVYSETVPLEVKIYYIKELQKVNSNSTPNITFEQNDTFAEEIVSLTAKKYMSTIENYNRVNSENQEIMPRK